MHKPSMTRRSAAHKRFARGKTLVGRNSFLPDQGFDPGAPQSAALWGNGDIDGFINAYLTAAANGEIKK